ncbi:MAG: ABC transporter ATP-binding protein [Ezakiella sp.]|uniref:ABC transporter ATP-binding protein n=1 Tax=Ezakiella sp. TaxID=1935205 RepID=UPI00297ABA3E|nr:ABC transporter ATP-binding protein [Ezakiella sp.]MDD7730871.1 ABC transporter ATP-binding protein [Eubacteriales bacterium]MDY6080287.1 ABC transporter ATP-binding protein [Ezakiella sp.]
MKFLKSISRYMKPYKTKYIIGVLWLIVIDTLVIYVPQILRNFANDYQNGTLTKDKLVTYALLTIGAGLIMSIGRYFWRVCLFGSARRIEYDIRRQLFNHWLSMDNEFYNYHKIGDLMAYATNDINSVRMFTGEGIMMSVDSSFMLIFTIIMMIRTVGVRITATTLFPIPITAAIVIASGKIFYRIFRKRQEAYAKLSDVTTESFSGISVIKAFVEEEETKKRFDEANKNYYNKDLNVVKTQTFFFPFMILLAGISYMLVIFFGAKYVIDGTITLGDFVALYTYVGIIMWPARSLGIIIGQIQQGSAGLFRIEDMLKNKPTIKDVENPIRLTDDKTSIEFKNVSFKYPGEENYALKNISFKLENGKSLALVGKTGSSKSTILKLIFREYLPDEGEILIDNQPIERIRINDLSEKTGYVPQDNFLFSESLKENIAFSFERDYDIEEVYEAAKKSGVYKDIIDFKDGFDTVIGERGVTLSGGQKQRVSIARALIKNPSLLVLDDSLSAVDTNTEKSILEALDKINATEVIIAHRISTIKACDEIIFLEDGLIKERGTHDELVELDGEYNKMYQNQLLEDELKGGF